MKSSTVVYTKNTVRVIFSKLTVGVNFITSLDMGVLTVSVILYSDD